MDIGAYNLKVTGSQSRWTVAGAIACFALAAGLLIFSLSHAGAATLPQSATTFSGSP